MNWQTSAADAIPPQHWRNGGGLTRELLAWPQVHDWVVRISVADIAAAGPFSAFAGVDRWFGVVDGQGVVLDGCPLHRGDPLHRFAGEAAPDCQLIMGPTRDINFMHRRGHGRFTIRPAGRPVVSPAGAAGELPSGTGATAPSGRLAPPRADAGTLQHERLAWIGLFTVQGGRLEYPQGACDLAPLELAWTVDVAPGWCHFIDRGNLHGAWWLLLEIE